jgi:hypothetical protein
VLNFQADFWLVFWTILGSAALLTAVLCCAVAIVPAPRIRRHHQPPVRQHRHLPAKRPHAGHLPHPA